MPCIAASILAAGLSTRFKGDKLLAELGGKPVVRWVLDTVSRVELIRRRSVVTRASHVEFFKAVEGFEVLVNNNPQLGLSSSVRIAAEWIPSDCIGLLLLLGDQPLVSSSTITRLVEEFLNGGYLVVSASRRGEPVNPALFHRSLVDELKELKGDRGAKEVIKRRFNETRLVEVDERELVDVDTAEALGLAEKYARELGYLH